MNAIRQIVEVKNHQINVELPENFDAEFVEVIIFRKEEESESEFEISEEEKQLMRDRIKNSKPENFKSWRAIRKQYL